MIALPLFSSRLFVCMAERKRASLSIYSEILFISYSAAPLDISSCLGRATRIWAATPYILSVHVH